MAATRLGPGGAGTLGSAARHRRRRPRPRGFEPEPRGLLLVGVLDRREDRRAVPPPLEPPDSPGKRGTWTPEFDRPPPRTRGRVEVRLRCDARCSSRRMTAMEPSPPNDPKPPPRLLLPVGSGSRRSRRTSSSGGRSRCRGLSASGRALGNGNGSGSGSGGTSRPSMIASAASSCHSVLSTLLPNS